MKTHVLLTAVLFVVRNVIADVATTLTSSLYANPTTCTTSIPTATPTALHCGNVGNITKATPLGGLLFIDYGNASPDNTCRDACFLIPSCRSFQVENFYNPADPHSTCQLYSTTLASQGFVAQNRTRLTFWDRGCFSVKCNANTTVPPTKTSCAPAETQVLQDPSFEAIGNGSWVLKNQAAIAKNKTNAYTGSGYAVLNHTTGGLPAVLQQSVHTLVNQTTYLIRFAFKIALEHVQGSKLCELHGGGLTITIFPGLGVTKYWRQIVTFMADSTNYTVGFQLTCLDDGVATDAATTQVEAYVDQVTLTNLATDCPFVLQIRSADSSINGQYLSARATDLLNPDDNFSEVGRTVNITAAPRFGQTRFGSVFLQDPELAPLNRFLFFGPGTPYHNNAFLEYSAEISAGTSAGQFGSGFESCAIITNGTLNCNHNGNTHFVFCKNDNALFLDNPARYPHGYKACTPVQLAVIYV